MAQIHITGALYCGFAETIDLPDGLNWEDISTWFIKWDTFHYEINGACHEIPLHSETSDSVNWKRPIDGSLEIYRAENGEVDHEQLLASC